MMPPVETSSKRFDPGTTGWTAADLDDPAIEAEWFKGRYEIVEGVLTKMPPAYFAGGSALFNLMVEVDRHCKAHGPKGSFATEIDIIIDDARVVVADAVFLTSEQRARQDEAAHRARREDVRKTRILVPPLLVIESVSPGHEQHDRQTKFRWYAEFGVTHYWIMDAFARRLECFTLAGAAYQLDHLGSNNEIISPSAYPGLTIDLNEIWRD
jgi:Uma2 family endonuclease